MWLCLFSLMRCCFVLFVSRVALLMCLACFVAVVCALRVVWVAAVLFVMLFLCAVSVVVVPFLLLC